MSRLSKEDFEDGMLDHKVDMYMLQVRSAHNKQDS